MDPDINHFIQFGGATFGAKDILWPFVLLKAYPHGIVLKSFNQEYIIDKKQIVDLIEYTGKITSGVLIKHNVPQYPEHIIFWTCNIKKLKGYFHLLGFTVKQ